MISIQDFNDSEYFITIDGEFVLVKGFVEKEAEKGTLKKDNAYIKGDHCYIYGGKLKEDSVHKPGYFYKKKDGFIFIEAKDKEHSSTEYIKSLTMLEDEATKKENLKPREETVDLTDLRVFAPPIEDNDDPLKRLIKAVLADLQVDMREYAHKFEQEYDMTNLKGSITKPNPLSMKYFLRWCEVLELTAFITVDSNNTPSKHKKLSEPKTVFTE